MGCPGQSPRALVFALRTRARSKTLLGAGLPSPPSAGPKVSARPTRHSKIDAPLARKLKPEPVADRNAGCPLTSIDTACSANRSQTLHFTLPDREKPGIVTRERTRFATGLPGVHTMNRRSFLKRARTIALGSAGTAAVVYPFLEAKWCRVVRQNIVLPNLPAAFRGMRIALLADVHHGPFVPLAYIRHVVAMTNALQPDLTLLAGDFVHGHHSYAGPGIKELGKLEAPLGRYAVRGNHDAHRDVDTNQPTASLALAAASLPE